MKNKSFTLIELLVVIAVIGLISSIVLVSLKGIREKARIAKALRFSHSVTHVLGAYAVGIWNFDDLTSPTKDGSGYGNHGLIQGAVYTDDTPHRIVGAGQGKWALSFDGVNDYVSVGDSPVFPSGTEDFTVEAWVRPDVLAGNWRMILCNANLNHFQFNLNNGGTSATIEVYLGGVAGPHTSALSWTLGNWYHIVWTRGGGTVKIYRNGEEKVSGTNNNSITRAALSIGYRSFTGHHPWNGLIDEVRIYNRALSAVEIQKHYAEGLENHKNLAIIK